MLTWFGYISEWVSEAGGDSCCWYTGIGIFGVKSTPFRLGFEVEGLADMKSWLNSTWIVPFVCCIIFEGVVKGLIGFGRVKSFNSHWPPWVISFHFNFLGTKA